MAGLFSVSTVSTVHQVYQCQREGLKIINNNGVDWGVGCRQG
jgi:hypothetical protein